MAIEQGLQRCRVLHKDTPDYVVAWLCMEHNGQTVMALVHEALKAEAAWRRRCTQDGLTTKVPTYQRQYDNFIRVQFTTFSESVNLFAAAKTLGHSLQAAEVLGEFEDRVKIKSLPCGCEADWS